jgi:hypothetical protein
MGRERVIRSKLNMNQVKLWAYWATRWLGPQLEKDSNNFSFETQYYVSSFLRVFRKLDQAFLLEILEVHRLARLQGLVVVFANVCFVNCYKMLVKLKIMLTRKSNVKNRKTVYAQIFRKPNFKTLLNSTHPPPPSRLSSTTYFVMYRVWLQTSLSPTCYNSLHDN